MSDKLYKRHSCRRHHYTIIEVLASMGIFIILITGLMQFFSSARTIWIASSRRNAMYTNARIALDLIARDLQSAMYQNDNTTRGIYPFWYRNLIPKTSTTPQVDELNFIAETELKPSEADSKRCEIRYTFISPAGPALRDSADQIIPVGWLVRSCVGDNDTSGRYNFADYSLLSYESSTATGASRMLDIWSDDDRYTPVIPGVIKFAITCYSDVDNDFPAMEDSTFNDTVSVKDVDGVTRNYPRGLLGTMFPQVVTIRIQLMDQDNWKIYLKYRQHLTKLQNNGDIEAAEHLMTEIKLFMKKTVRIFSKTVYLMKRNSS